MRVPGRSSPTVRMQLGREVRLRVRLHHADRAGHVLAARERTVDDDERVVGIVALVTRGLRRLDLPPAHLLLQREPERLGIRRRRDVRLVAPVTRADLGHACGDALNTPRPTTGWSTRARVPGAHCTTPAAYEAQMPGCASPVSSSIQTRASTRRTPSTNSTLPGWIAPGRGSIGAHSPSGTSTSVFTSTSDATSSLSTDVPYSTLHGSTRNRITGSPARPPRSSGPC